MMKKLQLGLALIIGLLSVLSLPAMGQQRATYRIDTGKSVLDWEGHRFFGGMHTGTIQLASGTVKAEAGRLVGGDFVINMNSIKVTDIEGEAAERLATHLKTEDFFDAVNFPQAQLKLKHIDYASDNLAAVVADITIRGISQQISFPATIMVTDGTFHAVAKGIRVDRTVHGSKYGSISFFRDLGRKLVADEIVLNVEIYGAIQ